MAFDAVYLSAVLEEVRQRCTGARVDKIHQPSRDTLILHLRGRDSREKLLFAANPTAPRLHLTGASPENPAEPPMFCMLLRKHLTGARIVSISQPEHERMLELEIDTHDELGFAARKKLVLELIGRSSNLILVGSDGRIIDCMRRMDFAGGAERSMMPGMFYRMPPKQNKLSVFDAA
ncbi:MAG: NFACT family protein, partial [Candidatus Faecousia sp.]|nr:NFACT family protein [Candidatus Faecousia sp.]